MTQRYQTADVLKGIAVVLMIQVHVVELFATPEIFASAIGRLLLFLGGPFVAPIFIFFLGYFIASSKQTMGQLLSRGLQLFLAGMLLNLSLNFNLLSQVNQGVLDVDIMPYLLGVDILHLAGFSIVVFAFLKKVLNKSYIIAITLSIIVAFLGNYLVAFTTTNLYLNYLTAFFYGSAQWSYFPVFPWMAYALLGYSFYQLNQKYDLQALKTPYLKIILPVFFVVFLILTGDYAITISANLQAYYHHGILFFMWSVAFLFLYGFCIYQLTGFIGENFCIKYLKWLGKNVTPIFIIQWVLIGNIGTAVYKSISSPFILGLSFIGILMVSSVLTFLHLKNKIPFKAKK